MVGLVQDTGTFQGGSFGALSGAAAADFLRDSGIATAEQLQGQQQKPGVTTTVVNDGRGQLSSGIEAMEVLRTQGIATPEQIARHNGAARSTQTADIHKDNQARGGNPAALAHTPEMRDAMAGLKAGMQGGGTHAQNVEASRGGPDKGGRGM